MTCPGPSQEEINEILTGLTEFDRAKAYVDSAVFNPSGAEIPDPVFEEMKERLAKARIELGHLDRDFRMQRQSVVNDRIAAGRTDVPLNPAPQSM